MGGAYKIKRRPEKLRPSFRFPALQSGDVNDQSASHMGHSGHKKINKVIDCNARMQYSKSS
ncbi:hypothetical protein Ruko_21950 [Ruthenibacterium sp. TH_2024_36131]